MKILSDFYEVVWSSIETITLKIMSFLPNLIGAIILLVIGWFVARFVSRILERILRKWNFDSISEKLHLQEFFSTSKLNITPSKLVSKFIYWTILLLFLVTASETLGWEVVSRETSNLIRYLPKLFSAIVIFVIGFYIGTFVRKTLKVTFNSFSLGAGPLVSHAAFYIIMVLVTVTALNQAGVNTEIITSNVVVIIGAFLLTFAIAFGIGSREVFKNILSGFYGKQSFEIGQEVEVDGYKGKIVKFNNINVVLETENDFIVIPTSRLVESVSRIKK